MPDATSPQTKPAPAREDAAVPVPPARDDEQADEMGCASFPASDPPATWTWDPR